MKNFLKLGLIISLFALLQACAFTTSTLDVKYSGKQQKSGPLSEVKHKNIALNSVIDVRQDKQRIGWKRNGFGQKTADIKASQPVTNIVHNALVSLFEKNGYNISNHHNIELKGDIKRFWIDSNLHFATIDFIGTITLKLNVMDKMTHNIIYSNTYTGRYTEQSLGGYTATWQRVMNKTLNNLVSQIAFDGDLVKALNKAS